MPFYANYTHPGLKLFMLAGGSWLSSWSECAVVADWRRLSGNDGRVGIISKDSEVTRLKRARSIASGSNNGIGTCEYHDLSLVLNGEINMFYTFVYRRPYPWKSKTFMITSNTQVCISAVCMVFVDKNICALE